MRKRKYQNVFATELMCYQEKRMWDVGDTYLEISGKINTFEI